MISYKISYYDNTGKRKSKVIDVDNEGQLNPYVNAMGLDVIAVQQVPHKKFSFAKWWNKPKTRQIIEILESLQVVVRSGLTMNTALTDLAADADTLSIKEMLMDVSHRIQMSMSLSEAMKKYTDVFGDTTIGLIRIGEETGQLDETLKNAAEYLTRIDTLNSKVKSALISPAVTLAALFGAMMFWLLVVLPQILETFVALEVDLPAFTMLFIAVIDFLKANIIIIAATIFLTIFSFFFARAKNEIFRYKTDSLILKSPILGKVLMLYNFAFVAEYTRLMIAAGLPLYSALGILRDSLQNRVFKNAIFGARQLISDGSSLSESLAAQKLFTPLVIRMIGVGEQTGLLEQQLQYVSRYYFEKVDMISENITQLIQPIITAVLGAFMVIMMLAFLMPIFDLVAKVGQM